MRQAATPGNLTGRTPTTAKLARIRASFSDMEPGRPRAGSWLAAMSCVVVVAACTTAAAPHGRTTPASRPGPARAPLAFPRIEGAYRQGGRAFVVTYQGWWLDMQSEQIRQLAPLGGSDFSYGPGFQVTAPALGRLHFMQDASGNVVGVAGVGPGGRQVHARRIPVTSRAVRFRSYGAVLAGTLTIPPGRGPHPGIVILQGSGALDRHFESISQGIYLSMGFAVLAFDKRGVGASTGVFPGELATPASIGVQADDAAAAARFLMAQPGIDRNQVGFDANSQSGWVAPLAAKKVPGLRFAIMIAAPAVTTSQQNVYASFSGGSQFVPSQSNPAIDAAVRAAGTAGGYDPAAALARFRIPAIWIYGQLDRQVPVRVCLHNLASFHNQLWTVVVLPGGSHGLIKTKHGLNAEVPAAARFAGNYLRLLRMWVAGHITFPG